jgi:predicted ArsR family transcriptional regulator
MTLRARILNACTTKPRTTRQVHELLQVPIATLKTNINNLLRDGVLYQDGMFKPEKGRRLRLYTTQRPLRDDMPMLTVWRPYPSEWTQS